MIIFRKNTPSFRSIENVFRALLPYLDEEMLELPYESKGLLNRLKNIDFLRNYRDKIIHVSGHDHYLLWWPFKKAILTIHDIEALRRKKWFKRWLFKKLWFDIPIGNAKMITTISNFSNKEIQSLGNYKTPIMVIHNPLTLPIEYNPKKFNVSCPVILHIGIKENKNLERLILALNLIHCQLVIIGEPKEKQIRLLNENKISFEVKSNLSNEQMIKEYKNCDLVSFISTYEGFGLPIIEAQACGRPVLTSNLSSMPEVAGNGAVLVNPFSIVDIRGGLIKIISNQKFRNTLIKRGLININRFKPNHIAQQYTNLYKKLSNEK